MEEKQLKKSIITVLGKDAVGIIAKVCTYLANNNINILDINQTITGGYLNMMMIVESEEIIKTFPDMSAELEQIGEEIGVKIQAQHEDILNTNGPEIEFLVNKMSPAKFKSFLPSKKTFTQTSFRDKPDNS